jgi:hypothetical protein
MMLKLKLSEGMSEGGPTCNPPWRGLWWLVGRRAAAAGRRRGDVVGGSPGVVYEPDEVWLDDGCLAERASNPLCALLT